MARSSAARSVTRSAAPASKSPAKKSASSAKAPRKSAAKTSTAKKAAASKATAKAKPAPKATKSTRTATKAATKATVKETINPTPTPAPRRTILSDDDLTAIWVTYKRTHDQNLRNILIEHHMPLVRMIAERLLQTLPKSIELDDLISAGLFGLMDAIRGFDASRGIKFKTYCSTRVRGAILDQLRSQDWVPRLVRLKAGRIDRALSKLTAEYGREPTHAELAKALEMDHEELVMEIQESRAKTMFSLSEKWEDDDGSVEKVEILEDRTAIDPVGELNRRDLMLFLTRSLTHKERFIIEQYYQVGHTMREIGEMLALTESRVCQIHSNVMVRLKSLLSQRSSNLST